MNPIILLIFRLILFHPDHIRLETGSSDYPETFIPALMEPRIDHEMILINDTFLVIGGATFKEGKFSLCTNNEMFSFKENKWKTFPGLRTPRCSFEAVAFKDDIFIIGGRDTNDNVLRSVTRLNVKTGKETVVSPMIHARDKHAAVVLNDVIYVIGGRTNEASFSIEKYNIAKNSWELIEVLKSPRHPVGAVTDGKYIYVISDTVSPDMKSVKILEQYNPITQKRKKLPNMPVSKCDAPVILFDNTVMIPGGWTPSGNTKEVNAYDLKKRRWIEMASLNDTRQFHAACTYRKSLIISGGSKRLPVVLSSVEIYNIKRYHR